MDTLQNNKSIGYLILRVTSAEGAIPIYQAAATVRELRENGEEGLIRVLSTDRSGLTAPIPVETPPASESLVPGFKKPYAEITAEVAAAGYETVIIPSIPIYPGITSIQPVNMIPLPS